MHSTSPPSSLPKHSPEMDAAFQKYLLLSGQQDTLRRRLSSAATSRPTPSSRLNSQSGQLSSFASLSSSPIFSSGSDHPSSPTSVLPLPPAAFGPEQFAPSHASAIVSSDPEDTSSDDVLYNINQAIKATLTELLNRDEVKHDEHLRVWVQGRLMDTQLELRRQRRRRSSASEHSPPRTSSYFE